MNEGTHPAGDGAESGTKTACVIGSGFGGMALAMQITDMPLSVPSTRRTAIAWPGRSSHQRAKRVNHRALPAPVATDRASTSPARGRSA